MDWRTRLGDRARRLATPRGLVLTRGRIRSAYAVAVLTDVVQFVLGPFGWAGSDEILDLIATIVETRLLGFHPLLLPTLLVELLPIADVLPTWTGCVALVVAMKKKQAPPPRPGDDRAVTIDVKPTSVT